MFIFLCSTRLYNIQISSVGATVPRQVMKHAVRNPCKIRLQKKSKRRRCDRKIPLSCLRHFLYHHGYECRGSVLRTPPPAYILSSLTGLLPVDCCHEKIRIKRHGFLKYKMKKDIDFKTQNIELRTQNQIFKFKVQSSEFKVQS